MAQETVGVKIQVDSNATESVGSLKQQLKQAQEQVTILAEKFGATSKEATDAAKKAAALKDAIGDAKALTDTFNPDKKFVAFGGAIQGVTSGFAGLQGAMGLLGTESAGVEKALLRVQSAMALQQGISGIAGAMDSVKLLGQNLIKSLGTGGAIGIAIAGVTALGLAISGVFTSKQKADAEAYNDTLDDYKKAAAGAIEQTTKVQVAFEEARKGVISKDAALKIYNDTLGDSFGKTNDLGVAEKNLADKADAYIQMTALKAQANALFAKSAEKNAEALITQQELEKNGLDKRKGIAGAIYEAAQKGIKQTREDAKSIQDLGADLLKQADTLAAKYKITTTKVEAAPKVNKKVEAESKVDKKEKTPEELELERIKEFNAKKEQARVEAGEKLKLNDAELRQQLLDQQIEWDGEEINQEQLKYKDAEARLKAFNDAQKQIDEEATENKKKQLNEVGDLLGKLGDIVGKQTVAGKALGIATALINTYQGATEALKQKSTLPSPFDYVAKAINVAAVIASGLKAVKAITSVKVPAAGGGGGGQSISTTSLAAGGAAPISPTTPQAALTQLDNQTIDRLGSASSRAYVIESDVTNNQERIRRINRAARLN